MDCAHGLKLHKSDMATGQKPGGYFLQNREGFLDSQRATNRKKRILRFHLEEHDCRFPSSALLPLIGVGFPYQARPTALRWLYKGVYLCVCVCVSF